jgi:prepilin-type processing-associated H-X9-DG protein
VGGPVFYYLLPYIEENSTYKACGGGSMNVNAGGGGQSPVATYLCPDDISRSNNTNAPADLMTGIPFAYCNYSSNYLVFGKPTAGDSPSDGTGTTVFTNPLDTPTNLAGKNEQSHITDGTSHTFMFGERYAAGASDGSSDNLPVYSTWANGTYYNPLSKKGVPFIHLPMFAYGFAYTCSEVASTGYFLPYTYDKVNQNGNPINVATAGYPGSPSGIATFQYQPDWQNGQVNPTALQSGHTGGINMCFCDGHVAFVGDDVDPKVWWALTTPNSGDPQGVEY